jgi:hypothetical protein
MRSIFFVRSCRKTRIYDWIGFKGNLYPFACRRVSDWPLSVQSEIGMSKVEYIAWCHRYHFPVIGSWIEKYQPKLFIGVGIMNRDEFAKIVFRDQAELSEHRFSVNGHLKRIFFRKSDGRRLVVIPHLSGSRHGLNSNESLQQAGAFIRSL